MITVNINIRKQGGAAIMTIPSDVLRMLHAGVGATLQLEVTEGAFTARPMTKAPRKRYSLTELMRDVTPAMMDALNADTEWARAGGPVGRELG